MKLIEVAVPSHWDPDVFTYSVPSEMDMVQVGCRVQVPFGRKELVGVVTGLQGTLSPSTSKVKSISGVLDRYPLLDSEQMALCCFVSNYYLAPLAAVLKMALPPRALSAPTVRMKASPAFKTKVKMGDIADELELRFAQFIRRRKDPQFTKEVLQNAGFKKRHIQELMDNCLLEERAEAMPDFAGKELVKSPLKVGEPLGPNHQTLELTADQKDVLEQIQHASGGTSFLIDGVTGSGKTEIYLRVAQDIISRGKSVLVIVPEISLTPQLEARFSELTGTTLHVYHSGKTIVQRRKIFGEIRRSQACVVLGTRSAIFSPIPKLGLIVVDECHDGSYKQDESPRYHARDVALWRAKYACAKIILGSATPSLESLHNATLGKIHHLKLKSRVKGQGMLPKVEVVDLKNRSMDGSASIFSPTLRAAIAGTLLNGDQTLLFLNRRGFSTITLCEGCGHIAQCPSCSISLTFHRADNSLMCHHCGHCQKWGNHCGACGGETLKNIGLGTERVEVEVKALFPTARIVRLDSQIAQSPKKMLTTLKSIREHKVDIIVGTQMLSKGHDFPRLSLVGIICADTSLAAPDFRAEERAFQILTQVAGRAGRGDKAGRVILQTFNPKNPAIVHAKSHNSAAFTAHESNSRKELAYPPYSKACLIRFEGINRLNTENFARDAAKLLNRLKKERYPDVRILGPAPSPHEKIRNRFRFQIFLQSKSYQHRQAILGEFKRAANVQKLSGIRTIIDVDPINLL